MTKIVEAVDTREVPYAFVTAALAEENHMTKEGLLWEATRMVGYPLIPTADNASPEEAPAPSVADHCPVWKDPVGPNQQTDPDVAIEFKVLYPGAI